jgi:hypothetical protein
MQLQLLSHVQHGPYCCKILVSHIDTSAQLDLVGCDPLLGFVVLNVSKHDILSTTKGPSVFIAEGVAFLRNIWNQKPH